MKPTDRVTALATTAYVLAHTGIVDAKVRAMCEGLENLWPTG